MGCAAGRLYAEAGGYPDAYKDAGRPARVSHPGGDRAIFGARDLPPADNILGAKPGSAYGDSYRARLRLRRQRIRRRTRLGRRRRLAPTMTPTTAPTATPTRTSTATRTPTARPSPSAARSPTPRPAAVPTASPLKDRVWDPTSDPTWRDTDPCAGEARPGLLAVSPGEVVRRGRAAFRREAPHLYRHARCVRQAADGRAISNGLTRQFGDPGIHQHRGQARRDLCGQLSDVRRRSSLSGAAGRRCAGGRGERPGSWQPRRS